MSDLQSPDESLPIEDYLKILMLQQQRIYDVLLTILNATDKENANSLIALHEEFKNLGPWPFVEEK